ncbi:MAG: peptide ABC transporter substrate-binding protein [Firmicutes bacterium]|nr:peptide ABC transporter substrate-binding protein [Bacillota bacterium]
MSWASTALMAAAAMGLSAVGLPQSASAAATSVTVPMPPMSTLDPSQNGVEVQLDQGVILEGLYGYNTHNQLIPVLAKSYKVSDGGLVWTFYLRHNARWSNGQPVTAQDFYYAWMRLASPQDTTGAIWQGVMTYVKNEGQYHAGELPASAVGLKVINPYELQITLQSPHNILGILASAGSMPLYPPVVKAHPTNWFYPQYFVGDGPYVVKSFTPNGDIVLTRNKYYNGPVGNVDQITIVPSPTTPVEDYLSGALDLAWITNPSDYRYILDHPSLKSQVHLAPQYAVTTLEWDRSPIPSPLDNEKVRQAIAMAINRAPLVNDVEYGMAGATNVFGTPGWAPAQYEHGLPYNVAKARKLLAEAGYPNGKGIPTLVLYTQTQAQNPAQVSLAEALAQEFKQELGINFKIDPIAQTLDNDIVYNGLEPGVKPGYVIGYGNASWIDSQYLPLKANQLIHYDGALGDLAFREYAKDWYFYNYDPRDVKEFGNPNDPSMGVSFSQWKPLEQAAMKDIAFLNAWNAKQPKWYQEYIANSGPPLIDIWDGLVKDWKDAKTPAAKHQAWVTAWEFVGTYSLGNGNASYGLNAQVYTDEHEGSVLYNLNMENDLMQITSSSTEADKLAADIANTVMKEGWDIPLFYSDSVYLVKPNITNVVANPFGWTWWNDLQYMKIK